MADTSLNHSLPSDPPGVLLAGLTFPSDALSIKHLRILFPAQFEVEHYSGYGHFFIPTSDPNQYETKNASLLALAHMLSAERVVARTAFESVRRPNPLTDPNWLAERDSTRESLEELYIRFRLADNRETARKLIQHVEAAARQLAK